jgi:hypothetical protein
MLFVCFLIKKNLPGIAITLIFCPELSKPFINQILSCFIFDVFHNLLEHPIGKSVKLQAQTERKGY